MDNKNKIINTAEIHIENLTGSLPRQVWFYLLYRAFPYIKAQDYFRISLSDLKKYIKDDKKDDISFKEAFKELISIPIEWKTSDKLESWCISTLLSDYEINLEKQIIEYSYSPKLKKLFLDSRMFLKLNLLISKKFTSKSTNIIYNLAIDYLDIKANSGEKVILIDELRQLLGIEEHEYKLVGDLHRRIIQKSEEDINSNSDIKVNITPVKTDNNKITAFKMSISIKEEHLNAYIQPLQTLDEPKKEFVKAKIIEIDEIKLTSKVLIDFLAQYEIVFVAEVIRKRLKYLQEKLNEHFEDYLIELKYYTESEDNKGKVDKIGGFYINLIKSDYSLNNYLNRIHKKIEKSNELAQKKDKAYTKALTGIYESIQRKEITKYFEENEDQFIQLIKKLQGQNVFIDQAISKNRGIININLLKNGTVVRSIHAESLNLPEQKNVDFNTWRNGFEKNPDNIPLLEKVKKESEARASQMEL